jgi:hypothetical protein
MRGTIAPTRSDAVMHQCEFHMSMTMKAVREGFRVIAEACFPSGTTLSTRLSVDRCARAPAQTRTVAVSATVNFFTVIIKNQLIKFNGFKPHFLLRPSNSGTKLNKNPRSKDSTNEEIEKNGIKIICE